LQQLRQKVIQHIRLNMNDIVLMKVAFKALDFMSKAMNDQNRFSEEEVSHIAETALKIHFLGQMNFTYCVETNYANKNSSSAMSVAASLLGITIASFSESRSDQQFAHSETNCSLDSRTVRIDGVKESSSLSMNMSRLDKKLIEMIRLVGAKVFFDQNENVLSPKFNSPYYKD